MTRMNYWTRWLFACIALLTHNAVAGEPIIVAHRAGTADAPENTLLAIRQSLMHGADALWLSVQLSADGVPVLYRPQDLSALTPGQGPVAAHNAAQLARLNAAWTFRRDHMDTAPNRFRRWHPEWAIPRLDRALAIIPAQVPVFLDLKSLPAAPLVAAVAEVLERRQAWHRVWLYSTDAAFNPLWQRYPRAQVMEARDATRRRLLTLALAHRCDQAPARPVWSAFELRRTVEVRERFTLGEGVTPIADAQLWTPQAMHCFRSARADVGVLWIGVSSAQDYQQAIRLGADAVMVDSPRQAMQWKRLRPAAAVAKPDVLLPAR